MILDGFRPRETIKRQSDGKEAYCFNGYAKHSGEVWARFVRPYTLGESRDVRADHLSLSRQELESALKDDRKLEDLFGKEGDTLNDLRDRISSILSKWPGSEEDIGRVAKPPMEHGETPSGLEEFPPLRE